MRDGPHLPSALFNATHIRLFLDRMLPSRAYLRFTGHLISTLCSMIHYCPAPAPSLNVVERTLPTSASYQKVVFQHCPGQKHQDQMIFLECTSVHIFHINSRRILTQANLASDTRRARIKIVTFIRHATCCGCQSSLIKIFQFSERLSIVPPEVFSPDVLARALSPNMGTCLFCSQIVRIKSLVFLH